MIQLKLSDYESGTTAPPFHPYCRSCTCPYFPDNYGERIARDVNGDLYHVPSDMKYQDWYKKFVEGESKIKLQKLSKEEIIHIVKNTTFNKDFNRHKKILKNDIGFNKVDSSFAFVDDEIRESMINQLTQLEDRFNCIHDLDVTIECINLENALGEVKFNPSTLNIQRLILNKGYYNNKSKLIATYKDNVNAGFYMPCGFTNEELIVMNINHEYAHLLQSKLAIKRYESLGWSRKNPRKFVDDSKINRLQWYEDVLANFEKECVDEIVNIAEKNNPNFNLLKNMSKSASMYDYEFFAEVFANSQSSKPNELGLAMIEWLKLKGF